MSAKAINDVLDVVQITDSHLLASPDGVLLGMNTRASLQAVLDMVLSEPIPDVVIVSGDISQDGSVASYRAFAEMTAELRCPIYWMCGNHDMLDHMRIVAEPLNALADCVTLKGWHLLMLNSAVAGEVHGRIAPDGLRYLENSLSDASCLNSLVFLHHHPLAMDSVWLDGIGLRNSSELFAILEDCDHLRGVVWGHVHQESDRERNGIRMLSTPSTCVQFEPKSTKFTVGVQEPGFRRLKLFPDGTIETQVYRVAHIDFEVDYKSRGY